jgi:hypothetical protein
MHTLLQAKVGGDAPASTEAADAVAREEADARSVYVGSVDYGCTPEELQLHFQVRYCSSWGPLAGLRAQLSAAAPVDTLLHVFCACVHSEHAYALGWSHDHVIWVGQGRVRCNEHHQQQGACPAS